MLTILTRVIFLCLLIHCHAVAADAGELWGNRIDLSRQRLKNILSLDLSKNGLSDLSYLDDPDVFRVGVLTLGDNAISDITVLGNFQALQVLVLANNAIADIAPLKGLGRLRWLDVRNNTITDLEPLCSLENVEILFASSNSVSRIPDIACLKKLRVLDLSQNEIMDMTNLTASTTVKEINLDNNRIESVPPLKSMTNLTKITLNNNRLTNISGLVGLPDVAIELDGNRLRLSQLMRCLNGGWRLYDFGTQYDVPLESMTSPLRVGQQYDLGDEHTIIGQPTQFTVVRREGTLAEHGKDYAISDGTVTFSSPGEFKIIMKNNRVKSNHMVIRKVSMYDGEETVFRNDNDISPTGEISLLRGGEYRVILSDKAVYGLNKNLYKDVDMQYGFHGPVEAHTGFFVVE